MAVTDSHWLWHCGSGVYCWIFWLSPDHPDITFMVDWALKFQYRFAPPASGETMQQLRQSVILSLIHRRTAGSAYRLSTGMSKKPCKENHSITQMVLGYRTTASLRRCWATEPQHHSDSVGLQNHNITQMVLGYRTTASLRWCWATEPQHHSDSVGLQNHSITQTVLGYRTTTSLK